MIDCWNCSNRYDGTRNRWRCDACGMKDTCCDGEPCSPTD